jgi:hypothetical protein
MLSKYSNDDHYYLHEHDDDEDNKPGELERLEAKLIMMNKFLRKKPHYRFCLEISTGIIFFTFPILLFLFKIYSNLNFHKIISGDINFTSGLWLILISNVLLFLYIIFIILIRIGNMIIFA